MPVTNAPLLALRASGIIGGRRKGYTRRLRFYVRDYPSLPTLGASNQIALTDATTARVSKFFLPFSMLVNALASSWPAVPTPTTFALAVYSEDGARRLIHLPGCSAPALNVLQIHALPATIPLDPAAYWIAILAESTPVNMSVRAALFDSTSTFNRPPAEGLVPYSGPYTVAVAGQLDPTLNLASVAAGGERFLALRLLN